MLSNLFLFNLDWWTSPMIHVSQTVAYLLGFVSGLFVAYSWFPYFLSRRLAKLLQKKHQVERDLLQIKRLMDAEL